MVFDSLHIMVDGFRGVSVAEDVRFKNKESALLKSTKFPENFDQKVDTSKVSMEVMRPWIAERVELLLGFEDDVLVEFISGLLENETFPDPRQMQIAITGFLEKKARPFMAELWSLLLSAQDSVGGIPRAFVEEKKREMQQKRSETDGMMEEVRRRNAPHAPGRHEGRLPSRFDHGRPPVEAESRGSYRRRQPDEFVDKRGNVTRRERDAGWGPRARTDAEDRRDDRRSDTDERRPRNDERYRRDRYDDERSDPERYRRERYDDERSSRYDERSSRYDGPSSRYDGRRSTSPDPTPERRNPYA